MVFDYLIGVGLGVIAFALVWYVLVIVASWRIFTKAGEAGWKSLIPIYNEYILYKISWKSLFFWIIIALSALLSIFDRNPGTFTDIFKYVVAFAAIVIEVIAYSKLAKSFGKGIGFTIGLILFKPVFMLILGLSDAQYLGNASDM